jgi:hypothetical protein
MNAYSKAPMMLAFLLAASILARPALGASTHEAATAAHHRTANFLAATALVRPAAAVADDHATDGLSRRDEDCNRSGCIDH